MIPNQHPAQCDENNHYQRPIPKLLWQIQIGQFYNSKETYEPSQDDLKETTSCLSFSSTIALCKLALPNQSYDTKEQA